MLIVEKPLPIITETELQSLIEEFKSSDFSDARKQIITSSKHRLTYAIFIFLSVVFL